MKRFLLAKFTEGKTNIAVLVLRIFVGVLMAHHGYGKLTHFEEYSAKFMDFLYLGPKVSLALVIGAEFFCSLLLVVGLFTQLSLIPLIITMAVALFKAHSGEIFGDGEPAFLYLTIYVALFITGPGKYSVDQYLFKVD